MPIKKPPQCRGCMVSNFQQLLEQHFLNTVLSLLPWKAQCLLHSGLAILATVGSVSECCYTNYSGLSQFRCDCSPKVLKGNFLPGFEYSKSIANPKRLYLHDVTAPSNVWDVSSHDICLYATVIRAVYFNKTCH